MKEERNLVIDIAKGIGIIFVVFGHNWAVLHEKGELYRVIYSFHMPLFFLLSGIFIRESDSFKVFSLSRVRSLLQPYFVTLIVFGSIKFFIDFLKNGNGWEKYIEFNEGVFYATGRTIEWIPMWFLPHPFVTSLATLLILKLVSNNQLRLVISIALFAFGVSILNTEKDLPWSLDLTPITASYIIFGFVLKNHITTFRFKLEFFLASFLIFLLLHFYFNETIDLNLRMYGNFFIATLQTCTGIYLCLSMSSIVMHSRLLSKVLCYIGSGTLFILIFHIYFQWKVFNLMLNYVNNPNTLILPSLVAGVALPLIFKEAIKKSYFLSMMFSAKA